MNNKRYMDFVPAKRTQPVSKLKDEPKVDEPKVVPPKLEKARVVFSEVKKEQRAVIPETKEKRRVVFDEKPKEKVRNEKEPVLGVVEDLGKIGAERGPLVDNQAKKREEEIRELKAKKVGINSSKEKSSEFKTVKTGDGEVYKTPKTPFINQDKVEKRPLSKNVYQKKVVVPEEEPKGPVTIITKPEKQAHVSLIVTIILTIILGAAAGTIAFLLLPK